MSPSNPIRILSVDDHPMLREGIAAVLGAEDDMVLVAEASNGREAVEQFRTHRPDVTLMDLQLPQMSGLDTVRAIKRVQPDARIIVLTMYQGEEDIFRAMQEGATSYLLKDSLFDDLATRIREVHTGEGRLPPAIETRLAERKHHKTLSPRERQIVELIAEGMRNKEIAAALGISEETVQVHMRHLFSKLGVKDRTAVLTVAARRGLIHLP